MRSNRWPCRKLGITSWLSTCHRTDEFFFCWSKPSSRNGQSLADTLSCTTFKAELNVSLFFLHYFFSYYYCHWSPPPATVLSYWHLLFTWPLAKIKTKKNLKKKVAANRKIKRVLDTVLLFLLFVTVCWFLSSAYHYCPQTTTHLIRFITKLCGILHIQNKTLPSPSKVQSSYRDVLVKTLRQIRQTHKKCNVMFGLS